MSNEREKTAADYMIEAVRGKVFLGDDGVHYSLADQEDTTGDLFDRQGVRAINLDVGGPEYLNAARLKGLVEVPKDSAKSD
jgi:hypothetical protein